MCSAMNDVAVVREAIGQRGRHFGKITHSVPGRGRSAAEIMERMKWRERVARAVLVIKADAVGPAFGAKRATACC